MLVYVYIGFLQNLLVTWVQDAESEHKLFLSKWQYKTKQNKQQWSLHLLPFKFNKQVNSYEIKNSVNKLIRFSNAGDLVQAFIFSCCQINMHLEILLNITRQHKKE